MTLTNLYFRNDMVCTYVCLYVFVYVYMYDGGLEFLSIHTYIHILGLDGISVFY